MTAPVLLHVDPTKPFIVETDVSDFAIGAILSQLDNNGVHHPVAYYSRKFTAPEMNYPIYDKELAAIISSQLSRNGGLISLGPNTVSKSSPTTRTSFILLLPAP
jgi:hypothetical protein